MTDHDDLDWLAAEQPATLAARRGRDATRPHARCSCTPQADRRPARARPRPRPRRARERRWLRPSRVLALAGAAAVSSSRPRASPAASASAARCGVAAPRRGGRPGRAAGAAGRARRRRSRAHGRRDARAPPPHVRGRRDYARVRPLPRRRHATTTARPWPSCGRRSRDDNDQGNAHASARWRRRAPRPSDAGRGRTACAMVNATYAEEPTRSHEGKLQQDNRSGSAPWTRCWPAPAGPTCAPACCSCSDDGRRHHEGRRGTGEVLALANAASSTRRGREPADFPDGYVETLIVDAEQRRPGGLHRRRPRSGAGRDDDLRHRAHDARARPAGIDARRHGRFTTGLGGMPRRSLEAGLADRPGRRGEFVHGWQARPGPAPVPRRRRRRGRCRRARGVPEPSRRRAAAAAGDDDDDHGRWKRWLPADRIGIQLFTVRDLLADNELDLPGTFEMLKDAGYAEVEIGGTYDGRTAADFRALAEAAGLKPEGSHVPGGHDAWRTNAQAVLDDAEALGLRYVGHRQPGAGHARHARRLQGAGRRVQHLRPGGPRPRVQVLLPQPPDGLRARRRHADLRHAAGEHRPEPRLVRARHRLDRGRRPERRGLREGERQPLPAVPRQGHPLGGRRAARHAAERRAAEPQVLARRRRQGRHRLRAHLLGARDPSRHHYFVEHDDAPDDETPTDTSPRPRNPAGSANTAWTSRKYLGELQLGKRRRRKRS